jgi:hypothetical protein
MDFTIYFLHFVVCFFGPLFSFVFISCRGFAPLVTIPFGMDVWDVTT